MNDPLYQKLRETGWRRKLTASEEAELRAWLEAHPEAKAGWKTEAGLNDILGRLPDAPVSSNFTARVLSRLDGMEREIAAGSRRRESKWNWLWHPLLPKAALAAMAFCIGVFTYREVATVRQAELAQSVATVSEVVSLPGPEILQDFEVIRQLNTAPRPDDELLALLK